MGRISHLECRECHTQYPAERLYFCPSCFAPLDVKYRYDGVRWTRSLFQNAPRSLWRYLDLLPIEDESKVVDIGAGFTPLIKATRLGQELGLRNLYIKNGSYDTANRLAAQAAEAYDVGVVNINLRTYYVEGSKTLGFEIAEQLGWQTPDHIVAPVGSGALLHAVSKGLEELEQIGLIGSSRVKFTAAQGEGCAPIVEAFRRGSDTVEPVEHPKTLAKSLAIGEPGDGIYVLRKLRECGGYAEQVSDPEIVEGIRLLAKTEGIFSEPAGGVVIGALKRLVEAGKVDSDETIVCLITGSGLKATDSLIPYLPRPLTTEPELGQVAQIIGR